MASELDELEINPFYKSLQNNFVKKYEEAQDRCYLLCIPLTKTISSQVIDSDFVDTHIIRPSPYFKDQYLTTHSSNSKTLALSDDGLYISTIKGFSDVRNVRILGEELAYNKVYKQYKIIIMEEPLDSKFKKENSHDCEVSDKHLYTSKQTARECTEFLHSFSEFKEILQMLNQKIQNFRNHYMVLEDYLDDAASRLQDICTQTLVEMLSKLKPPLSSDIRLKDILAEAIESYLLNAVYDKVFMVISRQQQIQDRFLLTKCQKVNKIRPEQIGVRKEFSCPLPKAVVELANIGSLQTPREKIVCLKSTVDNITEGVSGFLQDFAQIPNPAGIEAGNPEICITSDDLIPILVTVIAKAKCCHLSSDLFYVDHFMWTSADRDRDDLGFCLVSFKAAVQYMLETDFSLMDDCDEKALQTSLEDMTRATNLLESKIAQELTERSNTSVRRHRHEKQLNRITGLLEKTVEDLKIHDRPDEKPKLIQSIFPELVSTTPSSRNTQRQQTIDKSPPQLGDFLKALQDDDFDQSFGKLT
ncbi:hypothetical protein Btru_002215 [Bulinus truncatus]|nr:hypothetical protein Btru_002215 [Bulinus truncatus]